MISDREQLAAVLFVTRHPTTTWLRATGFETAIAYKQADAVMSLAADAEREFRCPTCSKVRLQLVEALTWLAEHKNYELSFNGWDEDPVWQVHSVNGGRNDREWTLQATGRTPDEALRKAMAAPDRGSAA